jgi:hypothetical protein
VMVAVVGAIGLFHAVGIGNATGSHHLPSRI